MVISCLVRFKQTFDFNLLKFLRILVEDSDVKTKKIQSFLEYSKLSCVHLNEPTPPDLIINKDEKTWSKPRGVTQRNKGIAWLRDNPEKLHHAGVVYFADDDNTYDIRLFEEVYIYFLCFVLDL